MSVLQSSTFEVYYLGMISNVNLGTTASQKMDVQLIDRIEEAQLEGQIPMYMNEDKLVHFTVSKYGIKVMEQLRKEVIQRHPLHTVAQIVSYTDAFSKSNLALKIGRVGRRVFDCHVFQCQSEGQVQDICETVTRVFDSINAHVM